MMSRVTLSVELIQQLTLVIIPAYWKFLYAFFSQLLIIWKLKEVKWSTSAASP